MARLTVAPLFNGLYKNELIHRQGPWRNVEHVEWATLTYVDWSDNRRLHGEIGMDPPVEFEATYYRDGDPRNEITRATLKTFMPKRPGSIDVITLN